MLPSIAMQAGYRVARQGATVYSLPDTNYLRISGETHLDFLQRQTTNDLNLLTPQQALPNVLTSPTARIMDVFLTLADPDGIGLITLPGHGPSTAQHLQSMIFFMDKVKVADLSNEFAHIYVDGPLAADLLREIGLEEPPALNQVQSIALAGTAVRVIGRVGLDGTGFHLLIPAEFSDAVLGVLTEAGAEILSALEYDVLRIEAGLPGPSELNEDYTPLEANLRDAVSDSKGCYTGQEVIARQITYDKVARHLVGLQLEGSALPGAKVLVDGRTVGTLTSFAESPNYGAIGLGYVRHAHSAAGSRISIDGIPAQTAALPFHGHPTS